MWGIGRLKTRKKEHARKSKTLEDWISDAKEGELEKEENELEADVEGRPREVLDHQDRPRIEEECSPEEATLYRSVVMRMNYLAIDRPDLQWSVRRCAKHMSRPRKEDFEKLKREARYLKGSPRGKCRFGFAKKEEKIQVQTDSD